MDAVIEDFATAFSYVVVKRLPWQHAIDQGNRKNDDSNGNGDVFALGPILTCDCSSCAENEQQQHERKQAIPVANLSEEPIHD